MKQLLIILILTYTINSKIPDYPSITTIEGDSRFVEENIEKGSLFSSEKKHFLQKLNDQAELIINSKKNKNFFFPKIIPKFADSSIDNNTNLNKNLKNNENLQNNSKILFNNKYTVNEIENIVKKYEEIEKKCGKNFENCVEKNKSNNLNDSKENSTNEKSKNEENFMADDDLNVEFENLMDKKY